MKKMYEQAWIEMLNRWRYEDHRKLFKARRDWVNLCHWKRAQYGLKSRSTGGTLHQLPEPSSQSKKAKSGRQNPEAS